MKLHSIKQIKMNIYNRELKHCFQAQSAIDFILQNKPVQKNSQDFKISNALNFLRMLKNLGN